MTSKIMMLADKAKAQVGSSTDVNELLKKIANENNLNKNEHQRLIEEYNVGVFLDKLRDGTQYEEYQVADPVVTADSNDGIQTSSELKKSASIDFSQSISDRMFDLSLNDIECMNDLEKVASVDFENDFIDDVYSAEISAVEKGFARDESDRLQKVAEDNDVMSAIVHDIHNLCKETPGMIKTAALSLAYAGLEDAAASLMEESKNNTEDIIQSKAEPIPSIASEIIKVAAESKKGGVGIGRKIVSGLSKIPGLAIEYTGKAIKNHPGKMATAGLVAAYLHSRRGHEPNIQREQMALESF